MRTNLSRRRFARCILTAAGAVTAAPVFLRGQDLNNKLVSLQKNYDILDRDNKIQLLAATNRLQDAESNRNRMLRNTFIASTMLFLGLAVIAVFAYRSKNKAARTLALAHDNLKASQEMLVQQEKLASLGQLTAGIAHEIKNPLNFVNNFSTLHHRPRVSDMTQCSQA